MSADTPKPDGTVLARGWIENSAFIAHLGIELEEMGPGRARLRLPFTDKLPTIGEVVHGGAISSLVDTAAAAAAWSGAEVPEKIRASTIGITVEFLAPARATDVIAEARVLRRGAVTFIAVDVHGNEGEQVATALVTYRL
jgi:uncharacterized protein (TIGR00369 family)